MNDPVCRQYIPVFIKEKGGCESASLFPDLRIGKCDPDFRNFTGCEYLFDMIYLGPDKSDIRQSLVCYRFAAPPKPCSFPVNPQKILLRIFRSQSDSIFSFSATQLKGNGVIVPKKPFVPFRPHRIFRIQITVGRLEKVRKG